MAMAYIPTLGTRLGITPEAWDALHAESQRTVWAGCLRKNSYLSTSEGASKARLACRNGERVRLYRCPFVLEGEVHFHLGHVPSMTVLAMIARTIRDIHHDRPIDLRKESRVPPPSTRVVARA